MADSDLKHNSNIAKKFLEAGKIDENDSAVELCLFVSGRGRNSGRITGEISGRWLERSMGMNVVE